MGWTSIVGKLFETEGGKKNHNKPASHVLVLTQNRIVRIVGGICLVIFRILIQTLWKASTCCYGYPKQAWVSTEKPSINDNSPEHP